MGIPHVAGYGLGHGQATGILRGAGAGRGAGRRGFPWGRMRGDGDSPRGEKRGSSMGKTAAYPAPHPVIRGELSPRALPRQGQKCKKSPPRRCGPRGGGESPPHLQLYVVPPRSLRSAAPAHYDCKFQKFSMYSMFKRFKTHVFEEGGHKWFAVTPKVDIEFKFVIPAVTGSRLKSIWNLALYPDGNNDENGSGHLSLYLVIRDTDSLLPGWEVRALFRLFLYNHIHGKYLMIGGRSSSAKRLTSLCTLNLVYSENLSPGQQVLTDYKFRITDQKHQKEQQHIFYTGKVVDVVFATFLLKH
ncbi:hypothetical protein Sjap_007022 [Stephania japonica]|uniref:MATH domain-containing protein n=1 Tax=Stephania japonica TaxID=461633 RepID=A0AAP0K8H3_9MAGN